nr:transglycosylase domain-containing protein [Sedimentibacter sp.]
MSKENNNNIENPNNKKSNETKSKKKKNRRRRKIIFRSILLVMLIAIIIGGGAIAGMLIGIIKSAPEIDPTNVLTNLTESSVILDENGTVIEQIHDPNENREIVKLSDIPEHLQLAFIAIEDHRFRDHPGIDIQRIFGSLLHNFKVGNATAQGASTITQQLVKNLYLTNEKSWERKIKEMYLAVKIERELSKDQILENYLNTIPLGQSSYGVQTAAYTYFSKDVSELTLAESALLAGAAKSTVQYAPFNRYNLEDIDDIPENDIVGYVFIGSVQYACVYNQDAIDRQHVILDRMLALGWISQDEYDSAMAEDMHVALNPGQTKIEGISSTSMDYVKEKVIEDLMKTLDMSYEDAESYLYKGGLSITTTIDINMQKSLESSYDNFAKLFLGVDPTGDAPIAQNWKYFKWSGGSSTGSLDSALNILDENGQLIYYDKKNILDENNSLYFNPDEYSYDENKNIIINSKKINIYSTTIDVVDCYTIDDKLNFVSHSIGGLNIGNNYEVVEQKGNKGSIKIPNSYIEKNPEMFSVGNDDVLRIPEGYFFYQEKGTVQPQSATVIMDYRTGKIKAMIGGRDIEGSKTFNRAVDAARQPGSTIKPLSVYLPALNLGYSAAYVLDDLPRYNKDGERWPKNWYEYKDVKYWGKVTLRKSIEQSINTNAVTMLETIGVNAAMDSLGALGMINSENPSEDTFISPEENPTSNDVNLASLALGGLTKGFSPLAMTAAYGAIANDGIYIEPISYTKVVNNKNELILENIPETHVAVSPEVASLMKDILRTTVNPGLSYRAKLPESMGIEVAGKTGTTQANGDFWFMGFSPYYVGGIWVGNDNVQMKLTGDSGNTARLWSAIMTPIHEGLAPAKFELNKNLIPVQVCSQSGKIPTDLCTHDPRGSQVITEYFIPGTQPTEPCDIHVKAQVCTSSNLLKSQYCPGNLTVEKIFIKRDYDVDANPYSKGPGFEANYQAKKLYQQILEDSITFSLKEIKQLYTGQVEFDENNRLKSVNGIAVEDLSTSGIVPLDYQYQLPSQICTYHTKWHYNQWLNNSDNPNNNDNNNENSNGNQNNNQENDEDDPDADDNNGDIIETDDQNDSDIIDSILDSITN